MLLKREEKIVQEAKIEVNADTFFFYFFGSF